MFDKVNEFIRDYDGTKYLVLFGPEKHNAIYDRIVYLVRLESGITYVFSYNYANSKINSDDDFHLEESLHNVIIHIKSVLHKNQKSKITTTVIYS